MFKELIQSDEHALKGLKQARILIADDKENEPGSLKEMLLEVGCTQLISSTDKEDILKIIRQGFRNESLHIDLLVLSSSIDSFDVLHFTQTLSEHDVSTTPIILIGQSSGWWDETPVATALEAGAIDLLLRPFRITEVIPRINLALKYRQERKQRIRQEENLNTELSERRVMESRLNYLLNHDDLTSLPSRHRLESALKISLSKTHNLHRTCALLYIDIDQFRIINDTMGHDRGDRLLIKMADLIKNNAPDNALIARIGSDEFGILIDDVDEIVAIDLAHLISNQLDSFICGETDTQMKINASIGVVAMQPGTEDKTATEVLARADQACHIAKERTDKVFLYNADDSAIQSLQRTRQCVTLVRKAISNDWFDLYLQPIVKLADESVSHYEVLVRMIDNQGDMHSPDIFVPAAESSGLINKLDFWVVDRALSLLERLPLEQANVSLSINLSGDGLETPAILQLIKSKLEYHSINPTRIMFELTETAAVKDVQKTRETISKLRALGCRFAIDDFGTGFSSFSYIKNYPVDFIKIDGMFIKNLPNEPTDQILVKSMIEIAHNLGKKVIAEYVENEEIMDLLRQYGTDYVQGYHLGRPMPAKQVFYTN